MDGQSPEFFHDEKSIAMSRHSSQPPRTPKPPFSPPRRRSSLAFSSATKWTPKDSIPGNSSTGEQARFVKPNISRKRTLVSPTIRGGPSPAHVTHMQRLFQTAQMNLHLDMQAASSSAGSIDSRMVLDRMPDSSIKQLQSARQIDSTEHSQSPDERTWRYSTAPHLLAATNRDVREPLPSPTLPKVLDENCSSDEVFEPASSGFVSPVDVQHNQEEENQTCLPPLPSSSPESSDFSDRTGRGQETLQEDTDVVITNLEKPMTRLRVTSQADSEDVAMEESPIVKYLKRRSGGFSNAEQARQTYESPEQSIYMSPSAEAAAESAKTKRKLLRQNSQFEGNDEPSITQNWPCPDPYLHHTSNFICPDPTVHSTHRNDKCPDPMAHRRAMTPSLYEDSLFTPRPLGYSHDHFPKTNNFPLAITRLQATTHRATATGSPMPFIRARSRPRSPEAPPYLLTHSPMLGQVPHMGRNPSRGIPDPQLFLPKHFTTGEQVTKGHSSISNIPAYSFSTAASKAVGSDQAPDSRIRDSYKTDTLTALAKPPNRYRKNGIGASASVRGVKRYYSRPSSRQRPATSGTRPGSRNTVRTFDDIHFRSSPPRSLDNHHINYVRKRRAADDVNDFSILEDDLIVQGETSNPPFPLNPDMMDVDDSTPCALRTESETESFIQEISPNVAIFRKGAQETMAARKLRRPSYWDNDLREVRDSPAGRGGVNSPISAQQSLKAEIEEASMRNEEMLVDDNDLTGEVARAGEELEKRLSQMAPKKSELFNKTASVDES